MTCYICVTALLSRGVKARETRYSFGRSSIAPLQRSETMSTQRSLLPHLDDEDLSALVDLALDLRWSWSNNEDALWGPLNPELWELTSSPWVVLQTTSLRKLKTVAAEPEFRMKLEAGLRAV